MPAVRFKPTRLLALIVPLLMAGPTARAAGTPPNPSAFQIKNSDLDATLFYQLLVGEMELRSGEAGAAYQVILDAARRSKDEALYKRATDIALQARAGEQALSAVQAWREAVPGSLDAMRYQIQLLVALNRPADAQAPLRALVQATPADQRAALILASPRFFARATDMPAAAHAVEQALQPYADVPDTRIPVLVTQGQMWLAAKDTAKALALAQRAHAIDPTADAPVGLALEMLPGNVDAEAIVRAHLQAKPDSNAVRLLYTRALTESQRYADAMAQLQVVTERQPDLAQPWLTLGALQVEMKRPAEATATLKKYVALAQAAGAAAPAQAASASASAPDGDTADDDGDDAHPAAGDEGLTQAWLLLSQAAEQQNDFKGAETWLAKIDNPQRALDVQVRRASLLAKQGRMKEARELIRRAPEQNPTDARAKLLAEAALLRDAKMWTEANAVLADANAKFPDDVDLLYEQSMMAEKLDRMDEMERLLRRVIELKPDNQQAYNALGYSLADRNLRLPEARDLIKKALDLSPGEPFITDSLGWVEYRMGHRDEAIRLLRGAYQSRPDPEIAAHLGEVLWMNGQTDEAKRVWREAHARDAGNDVLRETLVRLRVGL
ncbi:MAG: tetratricopeptide repeat protein [Proteobacteria bacterium]|nr:tetratricopeptide repeat protein [Pseudomonadota bacterium]